MPDFSLEDAHQGPACGIDEAGRGPLAGPVVAACVYIPPENRGLDIWARVNDSKKLSAARRDSLFGAICGASAFGIAQASAEEIDTINILQATMLAMRRAYDNMKPDVAADGPFLALIDGNKCPALPCPARAIIKGDQKSVSIAAASILAKVTRDRIMADLHNEFPAYGWNVNAGYGTELHRTAINDHGLTAHHRRTFKMGSVG